MAELRYFLGMATASMDPDKAERLFWPYVQEKCPELMQGIDTGFEGEEWDEITFDWQTPSSVWGGTHAKTT